MNELNFTEQMPDEAVAEVRLGDAGAEPVKPDAPKSDADDEAAAYGAEEPHTDAGSTPASEASADRYTEELAELSAEFPELRGAANLSVLNDPLRYAALRDLGLSPKEAYLATSGARVKRGDNRIHLGGSVPRAAAAPAGAMSARDLREARDIFGGDVSDSEIIRLYRRVTANQ